MARSRRPQQDAPQPDAAALEHIEPSLRPLAIPIAGLALDERQARIHPQRSIDEIAGSLRDVGQMKPIVVRREGMVVKAGNGTVLAARALGWTHIAAVVSDNTDEALRRYAIRDNRSAEFSYWNAEVVVAEDQALGGVSGELGWTPDEWAALTAGAALGAGSGQGGGNPGAGANDPGPLIDKPEELRRKWGVELGQMWTLGDHRILCGDSTKAEDVARLFAGDGHARLLATDPPYLVDYDGTAHPAEHHKKAGRKPGAGKVLGNKHWDAYKDPAASVEFFSRFLEVGLSHCMPDVAVYQWHATRRQMLVEQAWVERGILVHQTIVWVKQRGVLTYSHFLWAHEPCFYGWLQGNQPPKDRRPPPNQRTVWEIAQAGESDGVHPTQKPRAVFLGPIEWHTKPGEICYEPFSGSGTQIIAAEELGRRCFAMELSPGFVAAALERWSVATGKEPRKVEC